MSKNIHHMKKYIIHTKSNRNSDHWSGCLSIVDSGSKVTSLQHWSNITFIQSFGNGSVVLKKHCFVLPCSVKSEFWFLLQKALTFIILPHILVSRASQGESSSLCGIIESSIHIILYCKTLPMPHFAFCTIYSTIQIIILGRYTEITAISIYWLYVCSLLKCWSKFTTCQASVWFRFTVGQLLWSWKLTSAHCLSDACTQTNLSINISKLTQLWL